MEKNENYTVKMKLKSIGNIALMMLAFFGIFFAAEIIVAIVTMMYYLSNGNDIQATIKLATAFLSDKSIEIQGPMGILQNIITIFAAILFLKGSLKERLHDLKFTIKKDSIKAFWYYVVIAVISVLVVTFLGVVTGVTKYQGIGMSSFSEFIKMLIVSLTLFVSVGFGEEVMFRGYILRKLSESGNKYWAILVSAFIFMCMHIGTYSRILDFIDVFSAGLLLGIIYYKSQSLWLSIGFHFMWDFAQSFIVRLEDQAVRTKAIFSFSVPKDIYINGFDLGCKFEIVFILVVWTLIGLAYFNKLKWLSASEKNTKEKVAF